MMTKSLQNAEWLQSGYKLWLQIVATNLNYLSEVSGMDRE